VNGVFSFYHFVGIGGISMSGLAAILRKEGHVVSGSDPSQNSQTDALCKLGCRIFHKHHAGNITSCMNYVVINGAISDDNPELVRARELGICIIGREKLLAQISQRYKKVIAVAGTSGKSTTTAMIGAIFKHAGLDPTIHNGAAPVGGEGLGIDIGGNDFFITEACEFKRSFLTLKPHVAVITNINLDHLDCYKNRGELVAVFDEFASKADFVVKATDPIDVVEYQPGKYEFDGIRLGVVGLHNVQNARAAITVAQYFGISTNVIKKALESFKGISRRFERLGCLGVCDIITDYAHHPQEIATTIKTAKSLYERPLIIFQPHTYSRTLGLFNEFVDVFANTEVVFYKTYSAREKPIKGGRASDIARSLDREYFDNKLEIGNFVNNIYTCYDAIIFTGAGDIYNVALDIVQKPM